MHWLKPAFLLLLLVSLRGFSQQSAFWYFGNHAGLRFSGAAPVVLGNGALSTTEGCATISDAGGNLLFYTDGVTVYNRNHLPMPAGFGLMGHQSSSNSALIIPRPGYLQRYIIFTADASENQFSRGYRFSEVDMLQQGGLGDIIVKNELLYTSGTERMALVRHANGSDYWLVTKERTTNAFRVFKIDCGGVHKVPVISNTGVALTASPFPSGEGIGYLKASPDGSMVGMTVWDGQQKGAYLYRFNNLTGRLSDPISLSPDDTLNNAYSIEFSPNNRLAYVSYGYNNYLRQFDVSTWNAAAVNASSVDLPGMKPYAMQLGPDNKIYISMYNSSFLSVINQPNLAGPGCNYIDSAIHLQAGFSTSGLPAFPNQFGLLYDSGAAGDTVALQGNFVLTVDNCKLQLAASSNASANVRYHWNFGDGTTDTGKLVTKYYTGPGNFTVNLTIYWDRVCRTDSLNLSQAVVISSKVPLSFLVVGKCAGQPVTMQNQSVDQANLVQSWLWQFGDGQSSGGFDASHVFDNAGSYNITLQASFADGCVFKKSSTQLIYAAQAYAGNDTMVQQSTAVQLNGSGGAFFEWTPSSGLNNPFVPNPLAQANQDISYVLKVTTAEGCVDYDTVMIRVFDHPDIHVPTAFTPNGDGRNDLLRPIGWGIAQLHSFRVFNRWGNLLFFSKALPAGWDGKAQGQEQPAGVYVWIIEVTDTNGRKILKKGTAVLIR